MDIISESESSTSPYSGAPARSGSPSSSPSSPRDLESPSAFTSMCSSSHETSTLVLPLRAAACKTASPRVSVISRHPGVGIRSPEPPRMSRTAGVDSAVPDRCRDATSSRAESTQLKFGIDRILSDEMSPVSGRDHRPRGGGPASSTSMPCSECVCSLLRCCRLDGASPNYCSSPSTSYLSYYTTLHTPRPLRSYTNMLGSEGFHVSPSDRGSSSSVGGNGTGAVSKRKRSWSRAVFSNLQRKGLEKRFQLQKYITKPDRRQLAATLGLTDAQVKVWFQNRRMKWRHSKEGKQLGHSDNRKEHGGPDSSSQEPEIDVQTVDS